MAKTKLQLDYDYDFFLVGILTGMVDYRLSWSINKQMHIHLAREEDIKLDKLVKDNSHELLLALDKPEYSFAFPFFKYANEVHHTTYMLVGNKFNGNLLIKEEQSVDFFLIIEGLYDEPHREDEIVTSIRRIKDVITAYKIDPNQLKSKQNLIFE